MIDRFCSDSFWDLNVTWNTEVPDFTACFQDIIFVTVPCVIFCILTFISFLRLSKHIHDNPLPWTWLNISKIVLCVILFILSVLWCGITIYRKLSGENVTNSALVASSLRSVTFSVVIITMLRHRTCRVTTSTILSVFWIVFSLFGILMQRSTILKYLDLGNSSAPDVIFILSMLYFPMVYLELFLSIFADAKDFNTLEEGSPMDEASFLSNITFAWFNRIVYRSTKKLLSVNDFAPLTIKMKAAKLYEILSNHWNFHLVGSALQSQSLARSLIKSFWPWLAYAFILDISFVVWLLLSPLILDRIIDFIHNDQYVWRGYFYCMAIFISNFISKLLQNIYVFYLINTGAQIKSALTSAIYRKNLWISSTTRKDYSSGSLLNLVSVDVQRISEFALYSSSLLSSPFRIILIIYLLWQYLGPACLAGVAMIIALIPLVFCFSRISEKFTEKQMKAKDTRLKYMNEILNGIKILKFYAWEVPFSSKVSEARKEEVKLIRFSQLCYVLTNFVFFCAPILLSLASFTTFLLIDSKHILDPIRAFVSLNLMEQLKFALFDIPDSISEFIQTRTSLDRVRSFLITEDSDPDAVGSNTERDEVINMKNATFKWSKDAECILKNIDFNVRKGRLIAVVGPVGSGKSSLLSAILGEMYKISGSLNVMGTVAYVPQHAWILNRTLKDNILLVKPMREERYNKILDRCCLRPDLEILPGGDETEIGEKGINISGGQKQRVSLARAVYQDKDIYLLDDPLSAVDVHVRKALFDDVIGSEGLLWKKTRILVTHDISVLPHVDLIVSMNDGKIDEIGTYHELLASKGSFADIITEHSTLNTEEEIHSQNERIFSRLISVESIASKISLDRSISGDRRISESLDVKEDFAKLIEDEKMEIGKVKRGVYLSYIRRAGFIYFALAFIGYVAFVCFEAGSNIWVADWSSDQFNGTQDASQTIWRLSIFGTLGAAQMIANVVSTTFMVYGSTKASERYHKQMIEKIMKSPMSFFDTTPLGRIMNRFSTDTDVVDIQIVYEMDGWICCLLYVLATCVVIGINLPAFLIALIPVGICYYILQRLHLNTSRQIKRLESTTRSPIYSHFMESIQGVSSIKAYKIENEFTERLEEHLDKHITCYFNTGACNRWLHLWMDLISSLVILVATLLAILKRDEMSPSIVGLIITYAVSVTGALTWFVRTNTELENKSVSIERMEEYCNLESEAPWYVPHNDPKYDWPDNGEIVFDGYSTRYREELDLVLREIRLNVSSNEKVGIVGRTGAGKSSVTLALFRIIEPTEGTILIDNVDISKIGLHSLRSKLTIIPQDPVLFTGTLRFNLDPNNEYNDNDVWESLDNSHLKDFVSSLQEGLQYNLEESGANLSAGQKQLVCLSRALLKKTKILILDEATAAVDVDTDSLIQNTIRSAFANHTVITIAHRLNTVIDYDKIIVMDSGQVVEVGSPANLLKDKESKFYEMVKEAGLI